MSAATAARSDTAGSGGHEGLEPSTLWELHGAALYAMARVLLCDEASAMRAIARGLVDLYRERVEGPSTEAALRSAAECIYQHCRLASQEASARGLATGVPLMDWLHDVAPLQRHSLALCVFGGHTYSEVAAVMGLPPLVVAQLLGSGLRELALRTNTGTAKPPTASTPMTIL